MGYASLAGIVVNDSILLMLFLKSERAAHVDVETAASKASRMRFRAVMITSLTTIAGLMPLLLERSLQAQVLIPDCDQHLFRIAGINRLGPAGSTGVLCHSQRFWTDRNVKPPRARAELAVGFDSRRPLRGRYCLAAPAREHPESCWIQTPNQAKTSSAVPVSSDFGKGGRASAQKLTIGPTCRPDS